MRLFMSRDDRPGSIRFRRSSCLSPSAASSACARQSPYPRLHFPAHILEEPRQRVVEGAAGEPHERDVVLDGRPLQPDLGQPALGELGAHRCPIEERDARSLLDQRLDDADARCGADVRKRADRQVARGQGVLEHGARPRTRFAHDEPLAEQRVDGDGRPGKRVAGRADAREPLGAQRVAPVVLPLERAFDERAVDGPLVELGKQRVSVARPDLDPRLGVPREPAPDGPRHDVGAGGEGRPDVERDSLPVRELCDAVLQHELVVRHGAKRAAEQLARLGQLRPLAAHPEQLGPVEPLEVGDVLRHRRLRDAELLRGARVVERAADGEERGDAKVEHGGPFFMAGSRWARGGGTDCRRRGRAAGGWAAGARCWGLGGRRARGRRRTYHNTILSFYKNI